MKKDFLSWIYHTNADYDSLERASRHHILIHVAILMMVIAFLFPMILSITNNISFSYVTKIMLIVCAISICLFRMPYKKGKLNKYKKYVH